jgi:beta-lactamase class D
MAKSVRLGALALSATLAAPFGARGEGPVDLASSFERAFSRTDSCVVLRDVAPGAGAAVSDPQTCGRRLPPCATLEIPVTVAALDRGVTPDANAPVKRNPPQEGDPPDGVNLRDAFRRQTGWVFEEVARRIGPEGFTRSLAAMRYGDVEATGKPLDRIDRDGDAQGLTLSPIEQVDFLARLKRGELPTSAESQARTVEVVATERVGDATIAWKSGSCDGVAWSVGWVDRAQRSVIFAAAMTSENRSTDETTQRMKRLMGELQLIPPPK